MDHLQKPINSSRPVQPEDGGKVVNFCDGFKSWEEIVEGMKKIGIDIEYEEIKNG